MLLQEGGQYNRLIQKAVLNFYVVSEGQIQLSATIVGQIENESSISVLYVLKFHHYAMKF
jgi:predicted naringenin-chalcone synthase